MIGLQRNSTDDEVDCNRSAKAGYRQPFRAICTCSFLIIATLSRAPAQSGFGKPVLDNDRVKVWDVILTPGQPVSVEHENNDYYTVFFTGGKIRTTSADGKTSVTERKFGDVDFERKGTDEKLKVLSASPARLKVVELKDHPVPPLVNKSGYPAAFPRPGSKKILENDRVVIWNYTFKLGVHTPMHFHDKDTLVLYRYDGSIKSTTPEGQSVENDYKSGDVSFRPRDRIHYEELDKGQETIIATELK